jgi:hypothetical protein
MPEQCQIRTRATQQTASLFDHLCGEREHRRFAASAGLGIAIQGAVMSILMIVSQGTTYQTVSTPAEHGFVVVRFAPQASPAAIAEFLDRYEAELIGIPQRGGFLPRPEASASPGRAIADFEGDPHPEDRKPRQGRPARGPGPL